MPRQAKTYVAEVFLPTSVFGPPDARLPLPRPAHFDVTRGYLRFMWDWDHLGTQRPIGLALVAELTAPNRPQAEDTALAAGSKLMELLSLYSGSPLERPRLVRLARTGPHEGLFEQHVYYYEHEPDNRPRIHLDLNELKRLSDWSSDADPGDLDRIDLATRWYGMSVGADDPLDAYLSAWIGLESIGPAYHAKVHIAGPRARCPVCKNPAGVERDRKKAGIEHVLSLRAPVPTRTYKFKGLEDIRNQIAHGLAPASELRKAAAKLIPDLRLCLGNAILTTLRPATSRPGSGGLVLPRDFEIRPDAMVSLISKTELPHYRAFYGEWTDVRQELRDEASRVEPDGDYVRGAGVGTRSLVTVPHGAARPSMRYQGFKREGHNFSTLSGTGREIPLKHWRYKPPTAARKAVQATNAPQDA